MKATGAVGDGSHAGDVDYTVSTNRFTTHGYRDHSGARKNLANARLGVRINDVSKLTLLLNSVDIKANDAGGLTADEWRNNRASRRAATSIIPAKIPGRPRPACAMSAS
jgi:iron complex outermembrane receptor protein